MTAKEALTNMRNWFTDETKWCQGSSAKDETGHAVPIDDPKACKFCLSGRLGKEFCSLSAMDEKFSVEIDKAIRALNTACGMNFVLFNDSDKITTFPDIQRVVSEAIELVES